MRGERLWWWLHPVHVTQQYHLASMAAWLSSTGISPPWSPPSHPLDCISTVNSSSSPGIAPQSLNYSSQPLHLLGTCIPVWGMYGCGKDCLILIPFRLPQISCFTLGLKCFSFDSDNCPDVGVRLLLQFPHPPKVGPVLLTLLFSPLIPSSYWVLRGLIFSFPLVRYSYLLSAGVLHALLCVKVYSWCIHGERCTPCPPTPPPSCSFEIFVFKKRCLWSTYCGPDPILGTCKTSMKKIPALPELWFRKVIINAMEKEKVGLTKVNN